jgi:predicted extracellular nuclease
MWKNFFLFNLIAYAIVVVLSSGCVFSNPQKQMTPGDSEKILMTPNQILDPVAYQKIVGQQFMTISEVQGAGHFSPFNGESVADVFGVVTATRADGFYLQSVNADDNDETSEGIFIFTERVPAVSPGDWALVSGDVDEFYPGDRYAGNLPITEIEDAQIQVVSKGNPLPDPVILGKNGRILPDKVVDDDQMKSFDLNDGLDFFESLESMLVQIDDAVVVGPSTSYKEIAVVADNGLNASGMNSSGGITVAAEDFNPERILLDDGLISLPVLNAGDYFTNPIIGIVDYSFGSYKVQPLEKVEFTGKPHSVEAFEDEGSFLTITSMNVENLDATDPDERFERLAEVITENLNSPSIIALQEIQDNNGITNDHETSANETYKKLIQAIQSTAGVAYKYVDVAPLDDEDGGEAGGNIRVGFLIKVDGAIQFTIADAGGPKDSVSIKKDDSNLALSLNPGRIDPLNYAFVDSRKPLIFEFVYNGNRIFIINNHWNSKGEDTPLFGSLQPPKLNSENKRIGQAKVVGEFVNDLLLADPDCNVVVLGDFNDFYFSESLQILEKNGLINLIMDLPATERYTYNYEGNSQNLDNFLVSPHLKSKVSKIDVLHINSEYSYQTRFSDHDPIIVSFDFESVQ